MKKLYFLLLASVVLFIPVRSIDVMYGKCLVWLLAAGLFLTFCIVDNRWLKAFAVWAVIRLVFTLSSNGFMTIFSIFLGVMCYQFMVNIFRVHGLKKILNFVCILALLQTAMLCSQHFGYWLFLVPHPSAINIFHHIIFKTTGMVSGFFGNPNISGAFLALCIPAFFRRKWCFLTPLVIWGLYISNALGGIIPAMIIYCIYCIVQWAEDEKEFCFFGFVMSLLGWVTLRLIADKCGGIKKLIGIRWVAWSDIWHNVVPLHPWIGSGLGKFKTLYPKVAIPSTASFHQAHNEYLQTLMELGAIGLVIGLAFILTTYIRGIKSLYIKISGDKIVNNNILIALCGFTVGTLNMMVNFPMHNTIGIFILMWAAMIEAQSIKS